MASKRPKVIKLHGDFLYDNIKNLRREITRLDRNMEEKLYQICQDSGLIVVGYSGNDESVMAPLRDMVRKPEFLNLGLHWCIQLPASGQFVASLLPPVIEELQRHYPEKVHVYAIDSFDLLMQDIFVRCDCAFPPCLVSPHEWSAYQEFYRAVKRSDTANWSTATRDHMALFTERAQKQIASRDCEFILAEIEHDRGREAIGKGQIRQARRCFEKVQSSMDVLLLDSNLDHEFLINVLRKKSASLLQLANVGIKEGGSIKPN
jgi:hypothetical protein